MSDWLAAPISRCGLSGLASIHRQRAGLMRPIINRWITVALIFGWGGGGGGEEEEEEDSCGILFLMFDWVEIKF